MELFLIYLWLKLDLLNLLLAIGAIGGSILLGVCIIVYLTEKKSS